MFVIKFEDVKKGQELRGVFVPIKIVLTLAYLKLKGYKPYCYRAEPKQKVQEHGWFVRKGLGGISGEPLLRFNWGTRYTSFHAYDRRGKPRASLNEYVPFKSRLMQTKI